MTTSGIRPLALGEVAELLDWARAEGWNPGLADAPAFLAADPQGFFGFFVEARMAAGISAVRYGEKFGFIGLYICHPDYRGKGYGRRLWDHAMAHLNGRTIGLDGVPAQQENYARMGFEAAYRTRRWAGRFPALIGASRDVVQPSDIHLPGVVELDAHAFPADRVAFLQTWLQPPQIARVVLRNGRIDGYVVLRQCHEGFKIGPLFATSDETAEQLFASLAAEARQGSIAIDVPDYQAEFSHYLTGLGFVPNFETARMYRGAPPRMEGRLVYGVTTLELG